jgi:hypothetical protein
MAWFHTDYLVGRPLDNNAHVTDICRIVFPSLAQFSSELHIPVNMLHASLYDLIVSSFYYEVAISNDGWTYCAENNHDSSPLITFPFVNACPLCSTVQNKIVKCVGNKPESGSIGKITSETLLLLLKEMFHFYSKHVVVSIGQEPLDFVISSLDDSNHCIGEIKAAPLVVLPLCSQIPALDVATTHKHRYLADMSSLPLSIFLPIANEGSWSYRMISLGQSTSPSWAVQGLLNAITSDENFLKDYFFFWHYSFECYRDKSRHHPLYWLTNGCGSKGTTNVSDSKTSVGMDRTDDIKKGIYQLLKIGAESRKSPPIGQHCFISLLSNLHAIRHHEDYIQPIENIMWRYSDIADLTSSYYNLYDGLFSFSL